ncbi:MAG: hypothetical protein KF784_02005 [Fimbriimonadaceae bacterium]|nr:hypothetical protein [Fimbriimonadaceae bacterium]
MKLGVIPILSIGVAVFMIVMAWSLFFVTMPNKQETDYWIENRQLQQTEADKLAKAKRRVEIAKEMVEAKAAAWRATILTNTPQASRQGRGIDLSVNPYQLVIDSQGFGNDIQRAVNAQVRQGGVHVVNGPEVPRPVYNANQILSSYYNYPAAGFPIVLFDLGQVTVTGTYEQITANMRSWARMPNYLAVADGLQLSGTSPNLTGTYNVTIVGYIRGKDIFPPVPDQDLTGGGGSGGGNTQPAGGAPGGGAPGAGGAAGGRSRPSLGVSGG